MTFTFVDLFAGIGGFHAALSSLGGECWGASEIDPWARRVYERNWGGPVEGDIVPLTSDGVMAFPSHDVLAAGFPCQPFSKSGYQRGMNETRGTLFFNICRVLQVRQPPVVLLENVRNLAGPRQRYTWDVIIRQLRDLGYRVSYTPAVFSPHLLPAGRGGRPQVRERVFITGTLVGRERAWEEADVEPVVHNVPVDDWHPNRWDIDEHLLLADDEIDDIDRYRLTEPEVEWIDTWNEFIGFLDDEKLPGFPIWADHLEDRPRIPPGAPRWKVNFLEKNARLYRENRRTIDAWLRRHKWLEDFPPSRRKLEWQAQDSERDLWKTVIHMRPSGIRVKKPTYLPALVAMNQTSIIGPRRRRITPEEAAHLQGLPKWFEFGDQPDAVTYKQLGNGVSVGAAYYVLQEHVRQNADDIDRHIVDAVLEPAPLPVIPQRDHSGPQPVLGRQSDPPVGKTPVLRREEVGLQQDREGVLVDR